MIGAQMLLLRAWHDGVWNMEQMDPDPSRSAPINTVSPGRLLELPIESEDPPTFMQS